MKQKKALSRLILHDIRSVYNVGSIFRTADAAGVETIYLSGFTPTPIDRFGRKMQAKTPVVLVFGNEVSGLPDDILAACDAIAEIPMHGKKESLNVSVAAGIALFRILDI